MLIQLKNAQAVRKETAIFPYSRIKIEICRILKKEGYIGDVEERQRHHRKHIEVNLKYGDGTPAIIGVRRRSRPSQRIYTKKRMSASFRRGFGVTILSTSRGILTESDARKAGVGGEVICEVW